jgi:3-hydroxyacyl-CoA dehydrogenase
VTTDYAALAPCGLVIEAVFEDMAVKREVFSALDHVVTEDAVLATNTSYLDVAALAAGTKRPERVIGLHFFSPAHVMKLLEVVRTPLTGERAMATAGTVAKRLRKVPVVAGVCDGFIGNRIMAAYREECEVMLEEGALPETVDAAMRDFGFAMGIFETQDMSGLDIAFAMRKRRAAEGRLPARPSRVADRLCALGRLGRKTGSGWYRYDPGTSRPAPDPAVAEIARTVSAETGITRREIPPKEIVARILSRMQAEGRSVLADGIARNAADIDVTMIVGYGFPRFRGGPMYLAALAEASA